MERNSKMLYSKAFEQALVFNPASDSPKPHLCYLMTENNLIPKITLKTNLPIQLRISLWVVASKKGA